MGRNKHRQNIMNRAVVWFAVALLVGMSGLACAGGFGTDNMFIPPGKSLPYAPNEVVVTLKTGATAADLAAINSALGGVTKRELGRLPGRTVSALNDVYTLSLPGGNTEVGQTPADNAVAFLENHPKIAKVQRNYVYRLSAVPNDPLYPVMVNPITSQVYGGQWALQPDPSDTGIRHIYAQGAWDIEKGKRDVVVAVIDTGVRTSPVYNDDGLMIRMPHPDLGRYTFHPVTRLPVLDTENNRLLPGVDFTDEDEWWDPSPSENEDDADWALHGTHVAGIIGAKTNNGIGVASLCWENVRILPIKVFPDGAGYTSSDMVASAIMYCISYRYRPSGSSESLKVDVINLSLGGAYASELERSAVTQAAKAGIVVVAAAGNDYDYYPIPPGYPAAFDDAICVGATDSNDLVTDFSQRGRAMDIAAPGDDILSTVVYAPFIDEDAIAAWGGPMSPTSSWDPWGNGYAYLTGTSMASPMVAAAAGLLRSLDVPGRDVRQILCETATPRGIGRPNDDYGWGLLNVEAAVRAACIDVKIQSPAKGSVIQSARPRFRIDLRRANPDTVRVWIDGVLVLGPAGESPEISNWQTKYHYPLNSDAGTSYIQFEYNLKASLAINGTHRIRVSASSSMNPETPPDPPLQDTDEAEFRISPKYLNRGWHLFSMPYYLNPPATPESVIRDTVGILARWNYSTGTTGRYAMYSLELSRTDAEASFNPPSVVQNTLVRSLGTGFLSDEATPPAGLGYWLYVSDPNGIPLPETAGQSVESGPYEISLYNGWNMVGNPFPFMVEWSSVVVEYAGQRLPATEAVTRGWISDFIYRYDSIYNRYQWQKARTAVMYPWEAQWVRVLARGPNGWPEPDIKLIVPPSAYTGAVQQ